MKLKTNTTKSKDMFNEGCYNGIKNIIFCTICFGLFICQSFAFADENSDSVILIAEQSSEGQDKLKEQAKEEDYKLNLNEDAGVYQLDLDKIVVTSSRIEQVYRNVPNNISIVSSGDIESSGAVDITEILDTLPSVDILEYGSFGSTRSVHTRGASSNQVITLVDGRPVNTPRDGIVDFNQISLSNVERIEVLRGPASAIYGANALGGVINIITKSGGEEMQGDALVKFGSFRTNFESISNGYKLGDFDYFVSYDHSGSEGHRDNEYYRSHNANINLGYNLNEENRISFLTGFYDADAGSPGRVDNIDLDDRTQKMKKFFDLTWDGEILKDQNILFKLYHNIDQMKFIETFDPRDQSTHLTKIYGTNAQFSQVWFDVFRTTFGTDYQLHKLNSSSSAKHDYNVKALYVETETDMLDDSVICKFGARWDDYSNFGDEVSPSASFVIWFFDKIKFHGLWAKSFRAPTFNDLYWPSEDWGIWGGVEGNANLTPEKSSSYELGVGGYLFESLKLDATLFQTRVDDLIEWTMDSSFWWRPTNIGKSKIKGIEAEAEYIIKDNMKLNLNYTHLEALNKDNDLRLAYRPKHLFKTKLIWNITDSLMVNLVGRYKTKRYTDTNNARTLSPYFVMDIDISYRITDNLEFMLNASNILDKRYEEEEAYSMPGHAIMAGVKWSY